MGAMLGCCVQNPDANRSCGYLNSARLRFPPSMVGLDSVTSRDTSRVTPRDRLWWISVSIGYSLGKHVQHTLSPDASGLHVTMSHSFFLSFLLLFLKFLQLHLLLNRTTFIHRYKPHFCAVILYLSSHRIIVHTHLSRSSHRISISIVLYFIPIPRPQFSLTICSLHPLLPVKVVTGNPGTLCLRSDAFISYIQLLLAFSCLLLLAIFPILWQLVTPPSRFGLSP